VAGDELPQPRQGAALDVHPRGGEDDVVGVARDGVGELAVQRAAFLVETPELSLVLGERPVAVAGAPPACLYVDVDPYGQGTLAKECTYVVDRDRAAAQRQHLRVAFGNG